MSLKSLILFVEKGPKSAFKLENFWLKITEKPLKKKRFLLLSVHKPEQNGDEVLTKTFYVRSLCN